MSRWKHGVEEEESLAEDDLTSAQLNLARYQELLLGSPDAHAVDVSALVFTLADFTSSINQGVHPDPASRAWPQLLGVSRKLHKQLARDPPPPQGVDEAQHGRLKTTLGNFLARAQKLQASRGGGDTGEESGEDSPDGKRKVKAERFGRKGTGQRLVMTVGAVVAAVAGYFVCRYLLRE